MNDTIEIFLDNSPLSNLNFFRGVGKYTKELSKALINSGEIKILTDKKDIFKAELIHYPYFDFFFWTLPLFKIKKTIVTIHDCIPLVLKERHPVGIKGSISLFLQKISLKSVSLIITDSLASKKDIIKLLKIPEEKIRVVYLGIDPIFKVIKDVNRKKELKDKYKLPDSFVLYVGDVNINKNLINIVKAFSKIDDKSLELVLVGKSFEDTGLKEVKELLSEIKNNNVLNRVKFLGFVPDEDLAVLYNLSSVYCQSSLYEGFGLQILEAMSCGCPVVTGNVSSMPEISGKAGFLVDPLLIDEISSAINKILFDKKLKDKLICLGFENVKNYSWKKTAEETINLYKQVLNK